MALQEDVLTGAIERWAGTLQAWLRNRSLNPEDVVQETFCRLACQDRPPERMAAWLFQVAINLCHEEARRNRRRIFREQSKAVREALPCPLNAQTARIEVRDAVERLPSGLREIVIARLWGELTLQETAQLLELSTTTVHRRYAEALAQLRVELAEYATRIEDQVHDRT